MPKLPQRTLQGTSNSHLGQAVYGVEVSRVQLDIQLQDLDERWDHDESEHCEGEIREAKYDHG